MQCRMEIPKIQDSQPAQLTVGHVFQFVCSGQWPQMNPATLELRLDKEDQYKLKLLNFEFASPTEAILTVTSYRPGQHQLKAVQLVDKDQSVVLGNLNFTVASVINPQEPRQEPYGPVGPFSIALPIWYPLTAALLLLAVLSVIGYRWKVKRDKRRLLQEMRLSDSAQAPYFQFYQAVRKLKRNYSHFSGGMPSPQETQNFIDELNQAYKVYLARVFEVPTLKWSERLILSDLKKNHRVFYNEFRLQIRQALAELARAQKDQDKMTGKDCEQLLDLLRKQVDAIEAWVKGKAK